jgi:hypothetical protein
MFWENLESEFQCVASPATLVPNNDIALLPHEHDRPEEFYCESALDADKRLSHHE